jgi:phosphoribosylformimino-5-aminoimidazole carboxamide ribotide isomerase
LLVATDFFVDVFMEIFPAIDLLGGNCVRLYQGDYAQSQVFNENPIAVATEWQATGCTKLHLVDLDGAKSGQQANLAIIGQIVQAVPDMTIQVGGGLRSADNVKALLDLGVDRAILGTVAIEQPQLVAELCKQYPGQIVVGIDARDGWVATKGWIETSQVKATDLAQQMADWGAAAIIYTDIQRDGTLVGPNLPALRELAENTAVPVIASGGVGSLADLLNLLTLEPLGVTGTIVGKALYTGAFTLTEALQAVGPGRWQDVPDSSFA